MATQKILKSLIFNLKQLCPGGAVGWSKSAWGHRGYYNWEKMIGLGFEEDQENSLDILIKFQDEHQQPESHTHEELFLPPTEISVTSHPHDLRPSPYHHRGEDHGQVEELIEKMRRACQEQEGLARELLSGTDGRKVGVGGVRMGVGRSASRIPEEEDVPGKRKIIRKRQTF